jgi:ferredoxin--NADP+ reductase
MSVAWHEGRVIENRRWTENLWSLRVEGVPLAFEAGQFVRIGLDAREADEGSRIARAFSFVNPPQDPVLEFYGVTVPGGPLSPRLAELRSGERLYVARNPAGFLVLSEVPEAESLWLISTGTGIAPFLSILRTEAPWKRFRRVVLVHAVRYARERVYREMVSRIEALHPQLKYLTFVSREPAPDALAGRVPAAIADGRLEHAAGLTLDSSGAHVMLCGNPDMLRDVQAALSARGLRKHRRRTPGHVSVESFW